MAYKKKTWAAKDVISSAALNNIENGVEANDTAIGKKADATAIADMLTKTEANKNYAKKTDLEAKVDSSAISDMLTKTEAGTTYSTKEELKAKAKKGTNISTEDAPAAPSGENYTKEELQKFAALINKCKEQLNAMNA